MVSECFLPLYSLYIYACSVIQLHYASSDCGATWEFYIHHPENLLPKQCQNIIAYKSCYLIGNGLFASFWVLRMSAVKS